MPIERYTVHTTSSNGKSRSCDSAQYEKRSLSSTCRRTARWRWGGCSGSRRGRGWAGSRSGSPRAESCQQSELKRGGELASFLRPSRSECSGLTDLVPAVAAEEIEEAGAGAEDDVTEPVAEASLVAFPTLPSPENASVFLLPNVHIRPSITCERKVGSCTQHIDMKVRQSHEPWVTHEGKERQDRPARSRSCDLGS